MIQYTNYNKPIKTQIGRYFFDEIGKGKSLKILGKFFYIHWDKGIFWFRFFNGYGLWGASDKIKRLKLFSERIGKTKTYKVFGWTFKILKPHR